MKMVFITMAFGMLLLAGGFVYALIFKKQADSGHWEEMACEINGLTLKADVDLMAAGGWELDRITARGSTYGLYRCVFKRPAH